MKSKISCGVLIFAFSTSLVFAHGSGGGGAKPSERRAINLIKPPIKNSADEKDIRGELIQKESVGDFDLTLKLVDAKDSVPDGGSHNLLVNIKRNGRTQYKLQVTTNVDDMSGNMASKSMMVLGDWYLAGYDLGPDEEYLITVSFETENGVVHDHEINYP